MVTEDYLMGDSRLLSSWQSIVTICLFGMKSCCVAQIGPISWWSFFKASWELQSCSTNAWIFQWIGTFFLFKTFLFTLVNRNSNLKNSSPLEIFPDMVRINLLCYVAGPSETSAKRLYIKLCVFWAFTRIDSHSLVTTEYLACSISLHCHRMLFDTYYTFHKHGILKNLDFFPQIPFMLTTLFFIYLILFIWSKILCFQRLFLK